MSKKLWIGLAAGILFLGAVQVWAIPCSNTVYVNGGIGSNTYDGLYETVGTFPNGPKATIQAGIGVVCTGGTVNVAEGLYKESNIWVNKSLTIQGTGATRDDVVVAPATTDVNADNAFTNAQNGFVIAAHNVTIKNLTINGRGNPDLTDYLTKYNFRAGIVALDASQPGGGAWNNLLVDNVVVQYTYRRGISVFPRSVSGTIIQNSTVEYVALNHGMYLGGQSQVLNNTIDSAFQGIVCDPDATTPAGLIKVNGNTLTNIGNFTTSWGYPNGQPRAIQCNPTGTARAFEVKDNTISDNGLELYAGAVGVYTRLWTSDSVLSGNHITLTSGVSWADTGSQAVGMLLGWNYDEGFTVANNHVHANKYGIGMMVFGSGSLAKPMILSGNTITSTGSAALDTGDGSGIYVANQYLFAGDKSPSVLVLSGGNTISGFVKGINAELISTSTQPLTVIAHSNNIAGNTTGIDASTMTTAVVDATNNWWGSATGPTHASNSGGTGDAVSDYVTFTPWLGAAVTGAATEEIPASSTAVPVGSEELGIEALVTTNSVGSSTVTLVKQSENPSGISFDGSFFDLFVSEPDNVTEIVLKLYYTGIPNQAYWFDSITNTWIPCSPQVIKDGYIEITINSTTSSPLLSQLTGTPFAVEESAASVDSSSGGCFIATAAFGSYQEAHVWVLRQFRDRFLLTNTAGQAFVSFYYRHSPVLADWIAEREWVKAVTRALLLPLYGIAYLMINGLGWFLLAGIAMGLFASLTTRRHSGIAGFRKQV